jgi:hypothetical protein
MNMSSRSNQRTHKVIGLFLALYLLSSFIPAITGAQERQKKVTPAAVRPADSFGGTWQPLGPTSKRNGQRAA